MSKIIYNSWKDLELILKPWALTICMENPEIPGRIQMERFIQVEIFRKESNTFQGITFFPLLPRRHKFSVPFVWITSGRLQVERKRKFTSILWMVQFNPVPVFGAQKNTSTIWRKFFTDISVQMVRAPFRRHRNKLIILQYKWKPTNKWMAREASERYNYMTKIIFYCCSKQ